MVVLLGSVAIVVACYVLVYYFGFKGVRCFTPVKLGGKTAVVTGGNTGIGKATALELAKRGSRVILACRNQKKAEAAVLDIRRESGNNQVVFMQLDLASLQSVRSFAETILKTELRVDILINNADDTTLIGLIQDGDETAYRQEVERLVHWCSQNHLELNPLKTVEMTVDFRRDPSTLLPLTIRSNTILSTDTFKVLGTTISRDLKWTGHIDSVRKKAQQRLYFLRQFKKFNLPRELRKTFYTAIIQSVLCTSITVWFGSASKQDKHRRQRTIRIPEKIIGINLPSIQDLYLSRTRKHARNISTDPSHPGCSLFELLPSGRRYRARYAKTSRHRDRFFPQAVALMNSHNS
ncbi:uncharacterized protein LOC133155558 isoform X12 [Syngnathus typhle]|uniref:uncharacterized protein LOC133155558 isoform X12 n=1 Tax=Syngnathus typhle TaxID=161592 RepID=UPI002A6AA0C9|nr:uncharacterized protein LOC133155558 isoform X12 [Syngnathus typhle]